MEYPDSCSIAMRHVVRKVVSLWGCYFWTGGLAYDTLKKEDSLTWEEDGVVYMEGRVYVPNNRKIKEEILKKNHNLADVRHPGQHRMLELIKRTYW